MLINKNCKNSLLIFLPVSLILSFIVCYLISSCNYAKTLTEFKTVTSDSSDFKYVGYEACKDKFINAGKDAFLLIDNIHSDVEEITIYFKSPLETKQSLKIYYSPNYKVSSKLYIFLNSTHVIDKKSIGYKIKNFNNYAKFLMLDIGDGGGDEFSFDKVVLSRYKYNFWNIFNNDIILRTLKNGLFPLRFLMIFMFVSFINLHFIVDIKLFYKWLYKKRYLIGISFVLFAVIFELSGSSIGMWAKITGNRYFDGVVLGKTRKIRVDEWGMLTPIIISQKLNNFSYFNNIIRGTKTDAFIIHGQPVKNVVSIFRPFMCGFIFLGINKGLAFFWSARFVCLFLVSFAFFMLITERNKGFSFMGAVLVSFAPTVQWWFAINGFVEMIIFGELFILILYRYMKKNKFIDRLLCLFVMYICAGGYILTLYPAWQVPLGYVFLSLAIWVIFDNYKNCNINKKDMVSILFMLVLLVVSMLYVYFKSADAICAVMNTIYPGERNEIGGGISAGLLQYWGNIFFPLDNNRNYVMPSNICENAVFFDLFPAGLILSFFVLFRDKIKDRLLIILIICDFFLMAWCVIGFSKIIAEITLLKVSPAYRVFVIVGFINVIILLRSMTLVKEGISFVMAFIISLILSAFSVLCCVQIYQYYLNVEMTVIIFLTSFFMFFLLLRNTINRIFIVAVLIIMFFCGALVNPIQKGTDVIFKDPLAMEIKQINDKSPGLWLVETADHPVMNYPIMQGASTVNSTNIYPNLQCWQKIDKENKYGSVYNRFAHVQMILSDKVYGDKFLLKNDTDYITVKIIPEDLIKLKVKYILTVRDLSHYDGDEIKFKEIYNGKYYKIYRLYYKS